MKNYEERARILVHFALALLIIEKLIEELEHEGKK